MRTDDWRWAIGLVDACLAGEPLGIGMNVDGRLVASGRNLMEDGWVSDHDDAHGGLADSYEIGPTA